MCPIGERELRPAQTALDSTPPERSLSSMDATAIRRAYEWPPSRRSVRRAGSLSGTRFDPVRPPSGSVRGVASGWSGFWSGSGRGPRPASGSGPAPSGAVRLRPAPSGTRSAVRRPVRHRSSGVHASVGPPSGPVRREISPSGGLRRAPRPAASAGRHVG